MIGLALAALTPVSCTILVRAAFRLLGRPLDFYRGWVGASAGMGFSDLIGRDWSHLGLAAANALLAAFLWWLSRRRRKRAPRAYGAKGRALIAALVARAREVAKPRPVLRPAPGGAR